MSNPSDLFFARTGMDRGRVQATVADALKGSDDGELFMEYRQSESFSFDDGRLKAATFELITDTRGQTSKTCASALKNWLHSCHT